MAMLTPLATRKLTARTNTATGGATRRTRTTVIAVAARTTSPPDASQICRKRLSRGSSIVLVPMSDRTRSLNHRMSLIHLPNPLAVVLPLLLHLSTGVPTTKKIRDDTDEEQTYAAIERVYTTFEDGVQYDDMRYENTCLQSTQCATSRTERSADSGDLFVSLRPSRGSARTGSVTSNVTAGTSFFFPTSSRRHFQRPARPSSSIVVTGSFTWPGIPTEPVTAATRRDGVGVWLPGNGRLNPAPGSNAHRPSPIPQRRPFQRKPSTVILINYSAFSEGSSSDGFGLDSDSSASSRFASSEALDWDGRSMFGGSTRSSSPAFDMPQPSALLEPPP
ncbi:hypothetical protein GGX14DRAFT_393456 [Mycena pura]|uniref:Uncharacterized protein n=1 Tax=Mycena pura TaxID=153505 RepID=A0AAD6VKT5_9AGAR|nr:hypothetical protein GGX14DRAFT_393456 [Mycena pura]